MPFFQSFISLAAPVFLIVSPVTSYADQIFSMHRSRSSAGFSLDIPLIMLTASIIKVFYWPGARFDMSLLVQTLVMLVVQTVLLKVALAGRATPLRPGAFEMKVNGNGRRASRSKGMALDGFEDEALGLGVGRGTPLWAPSGRGRGGDGTTRRPWNFWRWKEESVYWQYLLTLACVLGTIHVLIRPAPGRAEGYTNILGAVGLGIEALLPIPQLWQNYQSQSCKGFRLSVLINWLFGDTMKMGFFFMSEPGMIPWSFKACGIFQALCDIGLGVQYWLYGEGLDYDIDGHRFA